jgi:hypothetical protein
MRDERRETKEEMKDERRKGKGQGGEKRGPLTRTLDLSSFISDLSSVGCANKDVSD